MLGAHWLAGHSPQHGNIVAIPGRLVFLDPLDAGLGAFVHSPGHSVSSGTNEMTDNVVLRHWAADDIQLAAATRRHGLLAGKHKSGWVPGTVARVPDEAPWPSAGLSSAPALPDLACSACPRPPLVCQNRQPSGALLLA